MILVLSVKKKASLLIRKLLHIVDGQRILTKEIFDVVIVYHFHFKCVCTGFRGTNHFNAFGKIPAFSAL